MIRIFQELHIQKCCRLKEWMDDNTQRLHVATKGTQCPPVPSPITCETFTQNYIHLQVLPINWPHIDSIIPFGAQTYMCLDRIAWCQISWLCLVLFSTMQVTLLSPPSEHFLILFVSPVVWLGCHWKCQGKCSTGQLRENFCWMCSEKIVKMGGGKKAG